MLFNEKGVYLLYMQLNHITAWIAKVKIQFGYAEKRSLLQSRDALDDMNYCLCVLQSVLTRPPDGAAGCGKTCFPVLKYSFSNVVAPDPDGFVEEGKSACELSGVSDYHQKMRLILQELVLVKRDTYRIAGGCLSINRRSSGGGIKIFSALRVGNESL